MLANPDRRSWCNKSWRKKRVLPIKGPMIQAKTAISIGCSWKVLLNSTGLDLVRLAQKLLQHLWYKFKDKKSSEREKSHILLRRKRRVSFTPFSNLIPLFDQSILKQKSHIELVLHKSGIICTADGIKKKPAFNSIKYKENCRVENRKNQNSLIWTSFTPFHSQSFNSTPAAVEMTRLQRDLWTWSLVFWDLEITFQTRLFYRC